MDRRFDRRRIADDRRLRDLALDEAQSRLSITWIENGGGRGIRTPDRDLNPYNGLANRRLQPLGHPSAGTRRMRRPFYRRPKPESNAIRFASGF